MCPIRCIDVNPFEEGKTHSMNEWIELKKRDKKKYVYIQWCSFSNVQTHIVPAQSAIFVVINSSVYSHSHH